MDQDKIFQRHINQNLIYQVYWRDHHSQTADIDSLVQDFGLPWRLQISANLDDFEYLPFSEREIQFGQFNNRLPRCVFKKNLETYFKTKRGFLAELFENINQTPNYKYGPNDNNLLLGSTNPVSLIKLVQSFGISLQTPSQTIIEKLDISKYFAIADGLSIYSREAIDILEFLYLSDIDPSSAKTIKSAKTQLVPTENRNIILDKTNVVLPQCICQLNISSGGILLREISQSDSQWLVLGAQSSDDLEELLSSCNIKIHEGLRFDQEKNARIRIPDDFQKYVWQRDGGRCAKCGSQNKLEFDHIIPISRGGSNTARNIQLLCQDCNRKKGSLIGE